MTSGLCNPEYYRGVVLEIQKSGGERRRYGGAGRSSQ